MKTCLLIAALFLSSINISFAEMSNHWYSDVQVSEGEILFKQNCARCHGDNAEGTASWKQTNANGQYPPPPLNGTAHAWHHDLYLLRKTIREGGQKLGGVMPPFGEELSAQDIDRLIAYFQSKWPDEVYTKWADHFEVPGVNTVSKVENASNHPVTRYLISRVGNASLGEPHKTRLNDVWQVKLNNRYVYLLEGGKYAMIGSLLDLEKGEDLTEISRRDDAIDALSQYLEEDMIVFKPEGAVKAKLTVFTDTSCPYCKKLHQEMPRLLDTGIQVQYLPYARGGQNGPGYTVLKSVWCAKDRQQALTDAKNDRFDSLPEGNCKQASIVDKAFKTGGEIGITGTPALFKSSGEHIVGYVPYKELIQKIFK